MDFDAGTLRILGVIYAILIKSLNRGGINQEA